MKHYSSPRRIGVSTVYTLFFIPSLPTAGEKMSIVFPLFHQIFQNLETSNDSTTQPFVPIVYYRSSLSLSLSSIRFFYELRTFDRRLFRKRLNAENREQRRSRYNKFPPSGKHFRSIFHLSTHRAEIDRKFEKRRIEDSFEIRFRTRGRKEEREKDDNALEIRVEYQALLHVASKRIVFYTSSNNAFPFSPPSPPSLLSPCHVFPPLILNVPALNNNGSPLEVGLLENICRFPPLLLRTPSTRPPLLSRFIRPPA